MVYGIRKRTRIPSSFKTYSIVRSVTKVVETPNFCFFCEIGLIDCRFLNLFQITQGYFSEREHLVKEKLKKSNIILLI